jgi:hypothetical protein
LQAWRQLPSAGPRRLHTRGKLRQHTGGGQSFDTWTDLPSDGRVVADMWF